MEIPESQWGIIWKALEYWKQKNNLSAHVFSLSLGGIRPSYSPARIEKGIKDGSEEITSDLLHTCVRIFILAGARKRGADDGLTDQECIDLLTAPLKKNNAQGQLPL